MLIQQENQFDLDDILKMKKWNSKKSYYITLCKDFTAVVTLTLNMSSRQFLIFLCQ